MYGRNQYHVWLASLVIVLSLLTGAVFGVLVSNVFASEAAPSSPAARVMPVSNDVAASVALAKSERWSLVITQESAAVEAVDKVRPAVVTVLNEGDQEINGGGTGFFISSDGYLVTNNHVIEGAESLSIVYFTGGVAPATLVGTAKRSTQRSL